MMDFSSRIGEKRFFVLKYKIVEDKIVVYFANGKKIFMPYSIENERKILIKMEEQAKKYIKKFEMGGPTKKSVLTWDYVALWISGTSICVIPINGAELWELSFLPLLTIVSVTSFLKLVFKVPINKEREELEKIKIYFENEELLKNCINNVWMFKDNKKVIKIIKKLLKEKNNFDINTIDTMSSEDLNVIKTIVEQYMYFDLIEKTEENNMKLELKK